ncbi:MULTISPECIES: beta-ketoacyl-[acyl-carrier-protein] synthase family protein [Streptomycetaceae]|uniref:Type III PKS n=1 Tax=Streptantibioticus cattleyicolor (strain ATCC 35852 / DSM 46488 / JCM 4925 / NBRC 14057 / NRRL 8057) TaxID=1003195 RepID=F8K0M7_STREN|nr:MULTISPECIES: polyketide synthase [Streptomycetaceae]AEW94567.1 type III PKS [Streptantibioticus cattleyicolor NRRL 8057 = DSM 46488]MYS59206.1 PhlD [Streptomyces sp. SID5468]CCB74926.1 putative PhlD [Streptantibioticus cattleyicolor NRRL 8057 = DSM 46488]
MHAHVTPPTVRLADHAITIDDLRNDHRTHLPDHPKLLALLRYLGQTGVETLYWSRPIEEAAAPVGVEARTQAANADARRMAAEAATEAIASAGLSPGDIDAVITSHTVWALPTLDVTLVGDVGLRPDVARIPMATVACAGGVQGLVRATDLVRARPGTRVLVVVSEVLSTSYHRSETTPQHAIYKALFSDSAAACVVSADPLAPGFAIEETWEWVMPDSDDRYWGRLDAAGFHFESTKMAPAAPRDSMPDLVKWLDGWRPSWVVIHPGGPGIIEDVARALDLDPAVAARHAYASLTENGNLGGAGVLDVLRRTHSTPPPAGADGLMVGFGPGFTVTALRGTWR